MANREIRPIRVEGNLAYVPLTKGYEAIIDAADVPLVNNLQWMATLARHRNGELRTVYAMAWDYSSGQKRGLLLHRLIMGASGNRQVDHINGDGLRNCRDNLRLASHTENARNRRISYNNTSGVKGVCFERGKWRVDIRTGGKRRFIGRFEAIEDAAAAYAKAAAVYHGDFARAS